jgi:mono/diheme cytochrome c family protein
MLTSSIVCPNCAARLKVTGKIEEGKHISCPKCNTSFAFPAANDSPVPGAEKAASRAKAVSPSKEDDSQAKDTLNREPITRKVRRSEDDDSEERERPRRKKKKKLAEKAKPDDKLVKLIFAAAGILVYIVGAAGLVLLIRQLGPPPEDTGRVIVTQRGPVPSTAGTGVPVPRVGGPPAPPPATPVAGSSGPAGAAAPANAAAQAGSSQEFAAGKDVFANHCVRCHTVGAAGDPRKKPLDKAGSDPSHTVEWFMAFIADPKSQKPGTKMPAFGEKLNPQELQAVADYMASLK